MNHKKCLYSLLALGLTAAMAHAATPLAKPAAPAPQRVVEGVDGVFQFTGETPRTQLTTFGVIQSTNFDAIDGWDLRSSICGAPFDGTCTPPGTGFIANNCGIKDHVTSQNCCLNDPNEVNGWFQNILSKHCEEPHIDNLHPSQIKGPGSQHMRFKNVNAVGSMSCASPFMGSGCRMRFHTSPDRYPSSNPQNLFGRSVYSFEIAMSVDGLGTTRARYLPGFHTEAPGGGGIYAYNGNGLSGVYFDADGQVKICSTVACGATARSFLAYWKYDSGDYGTVTIDMDRCNNNLCYSYQQSGTAVPPSVPGAISTICTSVNSQSGGPLWVPPFNGGGNYYNLIDQIMFVKNNPPNDPSTLDLDNWKIVHTPCLSACCNMSGMGACVDTPYDPILQENCELFGGRYYPNVSCAQLGTLGFPPACTKDKGACCNSGPGTGGTCTDGVFQADCSNPAWQVWTMNATCDGLGFQTLCKMGAGSCSSGYPGHAAPHFCVNQPGFVPCTADSDCDVPGFCYAGHCTPHAIPGHCEYASLGFCQNMGQCDGGPTCVPADGTPGGCCDTTCATPVTCPGGAACLPIPQPCNVVPQGFDCAFCEGCDPWPTVGCTNIGSGAECPAPSGAVGPGTCVANPTYVCNTSADCAPDLTGGVCVVPVTNPGGLFCTSNDVCLNTIIGAAACAAEHTGACCDRETGICTEGQLEAACHAAPGNQLVWTKLATCAEAGCIRHTGACCDSSPGAGGPGAEGACTMTYPEDCPADAQHTWDKDTECAAIVCEEHTGACCEFVKGTCQDNVLSADCQGNQQEWTKATTCAAIEATGGCDAHLGACCDEDTFGGCEQTTQNACEALKKGVFYKQQNCSAITCVHKAIPTVSEWGIAVLTLLLLIGAKVYFGRRQASAA